MIFEDAQRILQRILEPLTVDQFLNEILGKRFVKIAGENSSYRASLLGSDPERVILDAFRDVAPFIGFHAASPTEPPPAIEAVADSRAFRAKIDAFHSRGYTVRIPQPRGVSPKLDELMRSLEFFFHQPASAEIFWSRGDAKAPPHYDDYDLIAIQLKGRKRWFISTDPSELPNIWSHDRMGPPSLARHAEVEVGPGDLLYLPRGTGHRVDALADSLHLSIGFVPLTLRDAVQAALDHYSDLDRPLREPVGVHVDSGIGNADVATLQLNIRDSVARLMLLCDSQEFIAQAMQHRSSRAIGDLKSPKSLKHSGGVLPGSVVRHSPSIMAHVMVDGERIVFSHPGGRIYIHRGVERSVRFIASTPEFKVRDIPGEIGDDIRVALVDKLLSSGFLQILSK
jgi:hypothetical protein